MIEIKFKEEKKKFENVREVKTDNNKTEQLN